MTFYRFSLLIFLTLTISCGKKKKTEFTESDLLCGKAKVTEILGYNSYFGGGKNITVKCNVEYDNSKFEAELIVDVSLIGEAFYPFKVGDSVVAKFIKNNKKIAELYLLKRYIERDDYWMDRHYTFKEVCENGKPYRNKATYIKGKITD